MENDERFLHLAHIAPAKFDTGKRDAENAGNVGPKVLNPEEADELAGRMVELVEELKERVAHAKMASRLWREFAMAAMGKAGMWVVVGILIGVLVRGWWR